MTSAFYKYILTTMVRARPVVPLPFPPSLWRRVSALASSVPLTKGGEVGEGVKYRQKRKVAENKKKRGRMEKGEVCLKKKKAWELSAIYKDVGV